MSPPARIVVAPDSFKGSLAAPEVAHYIAAGIARALPKCRIDCCPMADGGEGSIAVALAAKGGQRHVERVADAAGGSIDATFITFDDKGALAALLEIAQVIALPGAPASVEERSSYGVGQQIARALDLGARTVLIGLGGSSTNDAGVGMLAALGLRVRDADGRWIARPCLRDLEHMGGVDFSGLNPRLRETRLVALCDVDNPLCGSRGATAVFGPQKGVVPSQVQVFDRSIQRFAALCEASLGREAADTAGAGAAGGIGWALQLIGAQYQSGASAFAELTGLEALVAAADWVITGEGSSDAQTLHGKVPSAVAAVARRHGVAVTLLSGQVAPGSAEALGRHFDGCFSIISRPMGLEEAMRSAAVLLADSAEQLTRLWARHESNDSH